MCNSLITKGAILSKGDWGADDFCDPGEYAIGFQVGLLLLTYVALSESNRWISF